MPASIGLVSKMLKAPAVPRPTPEYIATAKAKAAASTKPDAKQQWAFGIQGGVAAPWPMSEGVFRGLKVKPGSPELNPMPLLSTAAFALTESGSTQPIVALGYSEYERPELLQMERASGGDSTGPAVPQYDFGPGSDKPGSNPNGLLLDGEISKKAIGYASTEAIFKVGLPELCVYCCPCCFPRWCIALPRTFCGPRNSVIAGCFTCFSGDIALSLMGVDPEKRTALNSDSVDAALKESYCCACLSERDFVTVKDGAPPPYINFRFAAPGTGGSRAYTEYMDLCSAVDKEAMGKAPFGVLGPFNPSEVTKLRQNDPYNGVTSMLFTATPDCVETKYTAPGPVEAKGCCGGFLWGWPALPFAANSVPSVKFNHGSREGSAVRRM